MWKFVKENFNSMQLGDIEYWFLSGLCNMSFAQKVIRGTNLRLLSFNEAVGLLDKIQEEGMSPGFLRIEKGVIEKEVGYMELDGFYSFLCSDCLMVKKNSFDEEENEITKMMMYGVLGKNQTQNVPYVSLPMSDRRYGNLILTEKTQEAEGRSISESEDDMTEIMQQVDAQMEQELNGLTLEQIEAEVEEQTGGATAGVGDLIDRAVMTANGSPNRRKSAIRDFFRRKKS